MKPNDHFSFTQNNQISQDSQQLLRLYLPIIGKEATLLYQYFLAFWDNGAERYTLGHVLNHLNLGMESFKEALDYLIAFQLVDWYQADNGFQVLLKPTLSSSEFFEYPVYKRLLEKKIGEIAVAALLSKPIQAQKRIISWSDLFQEEAPVLTKKSSSFDSFHFKEKMATDLLRFLDEKEDLLVLAAIAEKKKWTWYEVYLLAKETAVGSVISVKRMQQKLSQQSVKATFSEQEEALIREAKRKTALQFLAEIKQTRQATITHSERDVLQKMAGELGLLDEVINIILLLTFNKTKSANLNEKYALKTANDFAYQKISSAEGAVLQIRERTLKQSSPRLLKQATSSNIPKWSQPQYQNETSPERQAELEEQKRKLLEKYNLGGE